MGSFFVIDFSITPLKTLLNSKKIYWLCKERIPAGPLNSSKTAHMPQFTGSIQDNLKQPCPIVSNIHCIVYLGIGTTIMVVKTTL